MKKACYFVIAAALAGIDQFIKHIVRQVSEGQVFFSLPPLFELERATNTGAAFSLFSSGQFTVMLISALLLVLLSFYLLRQKHLSALACLAISGLLGGGLGNLLDRILYGGVTDYIKLLFIRFPIFNFADICVTLSVIVLTLLLLFERATENVEKEHG